MRRHNSPRTPSVWDDTQLSEQAARALNAFVERRLAEPDTKYLRHLKRSRESIVRLFSMLGPIDSRAADIEIVRTILLDNDLQAVLRYVAGPPISDDDLGVIVTKTTKRLSKRDIKKDPALAVDILHLICRIADPSRFPWLSQDRRPELFEIKQAIRATAALHASQVIQTDRRSYGREVEGYLRARLLAEGYQRLAAPSSGRINAPKDYPKAQVFYGECSLYGRRTDLLIGLEDGRIVAVEAKDSSSVVNSVKRVLNDTAAKAQHWHDKAGEQIIPIALLSGVFGVDSLRSAQTSGLFLIWAHDLDGFVAWLTAQ